MDGNDEFYLATSWLGPINHGYLPAELDDEAARQAGMQKPPHHVNGMLHDDSEFRVVVAHGSIERDQQRRSGALQASNDYRG